jgi:hypothetical protein
MLGFVTLALAFSFLPAHAHDEWENGQWAGQYSDPFVRADHPQMKIHAQNGTMIELRAYEPLDIGPQLGETGPVMGPLVHHLIGNGLGCDPVDSGQYFNKVVLVKRGECTFVTKVRNMQNAGAIAVIVHDNRHEPFIHMANDHSVPEVTVPSVFITLASGDYLARLLEQAEKDVMAGGPVRNEEDIVQVYLGPNNDNSMRLTINKVYDQADGTHNVEATMEIRRTAAGHAGSSFAKYTMKGTQDPTTRILDLKPDEWIENPGDLEMLGAKGVISESGRHIKGVEMAPFKLHWQVRSSIENGCGAVVKSVEDCEMTDPHGYCGQGCLKAVDHHGYIRIACGTDSLVTNVKVSCVQRRGVRVREAPSVLL